MCDGGPICQTYECCREDCPSMLLDALPRVWCGGGCSDFIAGCPAAPVVRILPSENDTGR